MARQNPRKLSNGLWQADMRAYAAGRHQYRTQKAARRAIDDARDAYENGRPVEAVPTLREFIPEATAALRPRVESSTWKGYDRHLRDYILPRVGDVRLDEFSVRRQQEFVAELCETLSPAMVHRVFATFSRVLNLAAKYELAPVVSKRLLEMPREDQFQANPPTVLEVERLAENIAVDYHALVKVCGYAGLRQGEAFALRPGDVDLERRRIHVRRSLRRDGSFGPTKGKGRRSVPMLLVVRDALRTHFEEGYSSEHLVFHREGRPVYASWFDAYVWKPCRAAAGVECRFHDLRHSAAVAMAQIGHWGPRRVQLALGHHDAALTLNVYGWLWADDEDEALERMDVDLAEVLAKAKEVAR